MKICYFGDYDIGYPRHLVLQEGLTKAGAEVFERHILVKDGWRKFWLIAKALWQLPKDTDIVLIAYSSSRYVWFARLLTRKPLVWNAFFSLYENWIHDRKLAAPIGPKAVYYWVLDFLCSHTATKIILEADADIDYFVRTFKVPRQKFIRIFVGYNEHVMQPRPKRSHDLDKFIVEFHGKYIPVQGVENIIRAAKLLEKYSDVVFKLIGKGQTYKEMRALAEELKVKNINFIDFLPFEKVVEYIAEADVCIGLLGDNVRVDQAIPNKVYEASGMKRASINADTKAIHELFTDRENILLVRRGDPQDLADKILELRANPELKDKIAENAFKLVREKASIEILGRELNKELQELLDSSGI